PLERRADEDRGVVDFPTVPTSTAAAVDLVAVVLVVGHPVDVVQRVVVVLQGVVVVVPELLQALLLAGQTLVPLGEDVVPRLIAAVAEAAPAGPGAAADADQAEHGADHPGEPFHRVSFRRPSPVPVAGRTARPGPVFARTPLP